MAITGMIEVPCLPALFRVAALAVLSETGLVTIIFFVTGDTFGRRFAEALILVTGATFHVAMLAQQGETRFAVIEACFLPTPLYVAVCAVGPERALVFVVVAMATDAGCL